MTVMGIITKPTDARATAPVVRLAKLDSRGRLEDEYCALTLAASTRPADVRRLDFAIFWRRAFRVEKYKAVPTPVRMTEGRVPRQSCFRALGPASISVKVVTRDVDRDCWTRVFRRSAGWRRLAEMHPVVSPAKKWNAR